ncbi:MAG: hypothetical protein QNJ72_32630 [Pleurocapsa sp. MO_226.B13]|nr:hypothetical protein [Pleurocapsa sp. MO_226.B13]
MTQVNSAIPFGQGQILNPYPFRYSWAFAFSLVLCPPEDSALITLGLLRDFDLGSNRKKLVSSRAIAKRSLRDR